MKTTSTPVHALDIPQTLLHVKGSLEGLTSQEAAMRLERDGPNRLPQPPKQSPLVRFLYQFHNVLIYVLLGAAVLTAVLEHWIDTGVIVAVVLVNALVGFIQEGKAEKALEALKNLSAPQARVFRDGALAIEDICTNNSTNLTAYKQCGKLVEIERSTEKQGSITQ